MKAVGVGIVLAAWVALLAASATAEITLRDEIPLGTAKLYQAGAQGYSLELVLADQSSGQARFLVNQKELTEPFDDEYTTKDNSTIQILEIGRDNQTGGVVVEIYFYGTLIDPLEFDEGRGYRVRRVISAFDYTQLYTQDEIDALGLPTKYTDKGYVTIESAARPTTVQKQIKKADLGAKRSTFSFGWLADLWAWVMGLFS